MRYDVFISYSSRDQKVAEGVCGFLEANRVRCFVAYRDINPGDVWAEAIIEALEASTLMVIIYSGNYNQSKQVNREMEIASEAGLPILTFRLSDERFTGAKRYYLSNLHWIDAFPRYEKSYGRLLAHVLKQTGDKSPPLPAADPATATGRSFPIAALRKAAELGQSDAQRNLGWCCEKGVGIARDLPAAASWYRKAADQGDIMAQYNLGVCYAKGKGVARDFSQAAAWYRRAAEQGDAQAQFAFGVCCANGKGVPKDLNQALDWLRKAADQGLANAQNAVQQLSALRKSL